MSNKSFFMVFVEGGNSPVYRHTTLTEAENEAKRLTEKTGCKSFVLMAVKMVTPVEKSIITNLEKPEELPF